LLTSVTGEMRRQSHAQHQDDVAVVAVHRLA
jgi:hypothetical protein